MTRKRTRPATSKKKPKKSTKRRRPSASTPASPPLPPPPPPDPNAWRRVDRDQLAELFGIHPETVSDYTREGMPVLERGGHGVKSVYDAVSCLTWWRDNKTELSKPARAQARAADAAAEFNELKVAERKGELVARDQVIREGQSYTKAWSTRVQLLPRQLRLAGIITADQEVPVAKHCREVLIEISTWRTIDDTERVAAEGSAA